MKKLYYEKLTDEQLNKLSTQRLFTLFKSVRAIISCIFNYAGRRCCEICHEYIGDDWENDVVKEAEPYEKYQDRIKAILDKRPDQFTHRIEKKKRKMKKG